MNVSLRNGEEHVRLTITRIILTSWDVYADWRIVSFLPNSLALQALELDENFLPVAITTGGASRDMSSPHCLLSGALTVRTDVAGVAQLRSAALQSGVSTLSSRNHTLNEEQTEISSSLRLEISVLC